MRKSKHFEDRQIQRSIPDLAVQLILECGDIIEEQKGGSCRLQISHSEARRVERQIKKLLKRWDKLQDIVVVETSESLITTYHQH